MTQNTCVGLYRRSMDLAFCLVLAQYQLANYVCSRRVTANAWPFVSKHSGRYVLQGQLVSLVSDAYINLQACLLSHSQSTDHKNISVNSAAQAHISFNKTFPLQLATMMHRLEQAKYWGNLEKSLDVSALTPCGRNAGFLQLSSSSTDIHCNFHCRLRPFCIGLSRPVTGAP